MHDESNRLTVYKLNMFYDVFLMRYETNTQLAVGDKTKFAPNTIKNYKISDFGKTYTGCK